MIKIFAKYNSDEKVAMICNTYDIERVQIILNDTYGGNWAYVDDVEKGEFLKFNDGLTYEGFDGSEERYCKFISHIIRKVK